MDKFLFAYVGTYTQSVANSGSNGRGIYLFRMNLSTGALTGGELVSDIPNPSYLAFHPSGNYLYATNEVMPAAEGTKAGSVSALSVDRSSGRLTLLNTISSEDDGPAHLSVHPSGKYVLVANYGSGNVAVLPIKSNGELGPATDVKQDVGVPGPKHPTSAPSGNFAHSGHDAAHAHMIQADPAGRFVLVSDLGLDRILVWKFDVEKGTLSANDPASEALPPGDGPRHFAFHPNGQWIYSLQEEGSTLVLFQYDATRGRLTAKQTVSTLPSGFRGTSFTSEVTVSRDGRFVYAANRLHDSIAIFSVGTEGILTSAGEVWTRGDYPRYFTADPTENFLYVCNQRSDAITTFRIDRQNGSLAFTGQYIAVGSPSVVVFPPSEARPSARQS